MDGISFVAGNNIKLNGKSSYAFIAGNGVIVNEKIASSTVCGAFRVFLLVRYG